MPTNMDHTIQELEDAGVPRQVHYAIGAGTTEYHPFKHNSASLKDFIRVMEPIRELPATQYELCLDAIRYLVLEQRKQFCNCYGRGLVYLRHLTFGRSPAIFAEASELLKQALTARTTLPPPGKPRNPDHPYQEDFADMLADLGIPEIEGYQKLDSANTEP